MGNRDYSGMGTPNPTHPHPKTWDRPYLNKFLVDNDLEALVKIFEEHQITGKELLNLTRDDLKEMQVPLVYRVRLDSVIAATNFPSQPVNPNEMSIQDMSVTAWVDDRMQKAMYLMTNDVTIPFAALVGFNSGRPPRRYGAPQNDDTQNADLPKAKKGDPCMLIQMKNAKISSFSLGGSGGEDQFTCNFSLSAPIMTYAIQQFPASSARYYADYWPQPHGVEVTFGQKVKSTFREWGKLIEWNTNTHFSFPVEFRLIVKEMLLTHNRDDNNVVSTLPKTVLFIIFEKLSDDYIPTSPLEKYVYPGPSGDQDNEDF